MSDTAFKQIPVPLDRTPASPAQASWPSALLAAAFGAPLRAQDTIFGARRIAFCSHTNGSGEWLAENVAVNALAQNQPGDVWRTIARGRTEIAAGQSLELRMLSVPSGPIVAFFPADSTWKLTSAGGRLRCTIDYDNVETETDQVIVERDLPASDEADAVEPAELGDSWLLLRHDYVGAIRPAAAGNSLEHARRWCEWPTATFTLEHRGGVRCLALNFAEVPSEHVVPHDSDATTMHDYPVDQGQQHPDAIPQTSQVDGATNDERRFGTRRGLQVAARQTQRLGPGGICWSSFAERTTEVTDTEADAVQFTSTTAARISVGDSTGQTAWDADAAGFDLSACYALRTPEHLSTRISGAASVPVRARVYARFTTSGANTGSVIFAASSRSQFAVTILQLDEWAWYTATGWLETTIAPDDGYPILQDFALVSNPATVMEIRAWEVTSGAFPVGS